MSILRPFTEVKKESRQAPLKAAAAHIFNFTEGIAYPSADYELYVNYYRTVLWIYACMKRFADRAATTPWKIQKYKDHVWTDIERGHKAYKRFNHPNEDQSFGDLLRGLVTFQHLNGDAYLELAKSPENAPPNSAANLVGMYNIRPDRMKIDPRKDGKGIQKYIFQVKPGARKVYFSPDQVVHFRHFSPWHDFHGQSTLEALATTITKEQYTDKYQENVVKSDAIPRGVLETDIDVDDVEAQRILDNWNNKFAGLDKGGSVAILPLGLKFKALSHSPKDIEYTKLLADNKERILAAFGMNPAVLGLMSDTMTRDNFRMQLRSFYYDTLQPYLNQMAERIDRYILHRFWDESLQLKFDVAPLMAEEEEAISKRFQKEILVGMASPNEARQKLGRDTYDGGDTYFILNNLAPLHSENVDLLNLLSNQMNAPFEFTTMDEDDTGSDLTRDTEREMTLNES